MQKDDISLRQYLILVTVGLQPALVKLVPGRQAAVAFRGAWLAPLIALVPLVVVVGMTASVGRSLPEGSGLGEFLCLCFGKKLGRVLCGVYGLWLILTACLALRFCAERFVSTIYPDTGLGLFFLILSLLVWQLTGKGLKATARAGELFFYLIIGMLALVLIMVLGKVRLYNLWPVWKGDAKGILKAGGGVVNTMSVAVGTMFLFPKVEQHRGGTRLAVKWVAGICLVLTAVAVVLLGTFGPNMVQRMQVPFFSLAKEVQPERFESLVAAVWVFTDVILLSVLLGSAQYALSLSVGESLEGTEGTLILLVMPGAYLVADSAIALERMADAWEPMGGMVLFLAVPLMGVVIGKLRHII